MSLASVPLYFTKDILKSLGNKDIFKISQFLDAENSRIEHCTCLTVQEIIAIKKYLSKTYSGRPVNGFKYYQNILAHSALFSTGLSEYCIPQLKHIIENVSYKNQHRAVVTFKGFIRDDAPFKSNNILISRRLDKLLGGGLLTGKIYEFCTTADCGALHFILTILSNILNTNEVLYFLDAKRDFSAKYMRSKLSNKYRAETSLKLLRQILVYHVRDTHTLIGILFDIKQSIQSRHNARVIIIHGLSALFSVRSDDNNVLLNNLADILRYLANERNMVVIITNLITFWITGSFNSSSKETRENVVGGKYWNSVCNVRIRLSKKDPKILEIRLFHSNKLCHISHDTIYDVNNS